MFEIMTVKKAQIAQCLPSCRMQGSIEGAVVDFGTFVVRKEFHRDLHTYFEGLDHDDARLALRVGDPGFVQPDPKLMLSWEKWGPARLSISNLLLRILHHKVHGPKTTSGVNGVASRLSTLVRQYSSSKISREILIDFIASIFQEYSCELLVDP